MREPIFFNNEQVQKQINDIMKGKEDINLTIVMLQSLAIVMENEAKKLGEDK